MGDTQRSRLEREMESVGMRLNQLPPKIRVTKKANGGVGINSSVRRTHLEDDRLVEGLLKEYRIFHADVVFREDATADQLVDVLEGNRRYVRCVYCYNKIDLLSVEQVDELVRKGIPAPEESAALVKKGDPAAGESSNFV